MLHQFSRNGEDFLVDITEINELSKALVGADVLEIESEDNSNEPRLFRIQLFHLNSGDIAIPIQLNSLPNDFQRELKSELAIKASKQVTFIANPYFDEVFIFWGNSVLTSQDRYLPISCHQCGKPGLYEKRDKDNKANYIQHIHAKLKEDINPEWPFKENLVVQFSVSDKQTRLNKIDLDNLAKTILDSMQGLVFEDDAQIVRLVADKESVLGMASHIIAIRRLSPGERPQSQEYLYSGQLNAWKDEYDKKILMGKSTRFNTY